MKTLKIYILTILSLAVMTACEKDGDLITLSGLEESELLTTETEVILTQENSGQIILSLSWSTSTLTVSDPNMSAPNILTTTLQVSKANDFSVTVVESVETSLSKAYTGAELNTVAKALAAEPEVATPLYFRLKASVGNNMDPVYSNIVSVDVTPYQIDMSVGFILNKDLTDAGVILYSAESDGEYTGFIGATSWFNFYLMEGDGAIWGNDGVSGTPFLLSSENDNDKRWNCWFPEPGGCYYVDFNTNRKQWSALLIPSLTLSGDLEGEMTFNRPNVKWTFPFNTTSTTITVSISGTGKLYNYTTGDAAAIDTPVAFAQNGETLTLADQAGDITVTVPEPGQYTLVIDLSDPRAWTCEAVAGTQEPEEVSPYVYLPGIDDGISGSWNFDKVLALYNEDKLAYAGVVNVNSLWGYGIYTEKDNWEEKYTLGTGDAYSGTLAHKGPDNIPAPAAGLYLIDISLKDLTYSLTGVDNQIYVSGLNDVWDFSVSLAATTTVGTYSGQITINGASPWGFQIHLDTSWNHYFGGSAGKLYYKGSNITDDASLSAGTYTLTVDLINGTYSIAP
ncbi:MAG: DUF5114 domain-containing protein [Mangrovibacterium sp.]